MKNYPNQNFSAIDNFIDSIKEMDLSNNHKIDLLIKKKFSLSDDELNDGSSLVIDYGSDYYDIIELMSEIEYIFNLKLEEGEFQLTVGKIKEYVKKKIQNPSYISSNKDFDWPWPLEKNLYYEHLNARSKAIKLLLSNNYEILNDEYENIFKELINFTIKYFDKNFKINPVESNNQLRIAFPLMHKFILRQIFKKQYFIKVDVDFDEHKGYDEFLIFCSTLFCSLYPNKNERDSQIMQHFKRLHNSLILFIDTDIQTNKI